MKALQDFLRPEFLNRVDEIVYFNRLTEENFRNIAVLMLEEVRTVMEEHDRSFDWDDKLVDYLVKKSYSEVYGARNLRRTIQKDVEDAVASEIVERRGESITKVSVSADDEKVIVTCK